MLCEECHVNEANFTVSVVTGEETTVRHLCADCMSRMNADLMKGNVRNLLSSVLSAIQATAGGENRKEFSMPIFGRFTQKAQQTLHLAQRIAAGANGARAKLEYALSCVKGGTTVIIGHARHHLSDLTEGRVPCTRIGVR